jgi:predicted Rossmann-fold nucleotide-binding protein
MEAINQDKEWDQPWGTLTVAADVQISGNWGLSQMNMERVTSLLSQYPELDPQSYRPSIKLPALRVLIKALGLDDLNLERLDDAVDDYFEAQTPIDRPNTSPPTIRPFNGKWILVAGTGDGSMAQDERLVSEVLGKLLAEQGFGLIGGGWPGVDFEVARSFGQSLIADNQDVNERLVQLLEPNQRSAYDIGRPTYTSGPDWNLDAAERADALVMIGGKGGTYDAFECFRRIGKTIIPIAGTGGDAQRAFDQMSNAQSVQVYDPNWQFLAGRIDTREQAEQLCQLVLRMLTPPSSVPYLS